MIVDTKETKNIKLCPRCGGRCYMSTFAEVIDNVPLNMRRTCITCDGTGLLEETTTVSVKPYKRPV